MQSAILLWQIHPSVCLSNAGVVSKRMDLSPQFFDDLVDFLAPAHLQNSKGTSLVGALNTRGQENFANIAICLGNGTR